MALYRCTDSLILGAGDVPEGADPGRRSDQNYVEDKVYDDKNPTVREAIKRYPDHFTTETAHR